jgi:hypothetical protein
MKKGVGLWLSSFASVEDSVSERTPRCGGTRGKSRGNVLGLVGLNDDWF